jgi:hypothetical protein
MGLQKKIHLCIIALLMVTFVNAQDKPASPPEVVSGKINDATISINYGSPSVKGRKIWGELVPFNKVWRAGANEATTFETNKEIMIEGSKLPAGKYSFFIIPNETESIIIFNNEAKQWGAYKYKDKNDQLRVTVKPQITSSLVEKLTYTITENSIVVSWDNWNIPIAIK